MYFIVTGSHAKDERKIKFVKAKLQIKTGNYFFIGIYASHGSRDPT